MEQRITLPMASDNLTQKIIYAYAQCTSKTHSSVVRPRAVRINDIALVVDVAGVKQLEELVARFAAASHVSAGVVEFTQAPREGDMGGIIQTGVSEDTDTILHRVSTVDTYLYPGRDSA